MRMMRIGLGLWLLGLTVGGDIPAAAAPAGTAAALAERTVGTAPDAVARFYAARAHAPLWLDDEGRAGMRAARLVEALQAADAHALPPARYDAAGLAAALDATGPRPAAESAALDLALTRAYLDYARDLSSGLLTPRRVDRDLDLDPVRPEPEALLTRMAASADPQGLLDGLAPAHPDYAALRDRLAAYRALAAGEGWGAPVPQGTTLREGDRSARVATLRRRLEAMGDLAPAADAAGDDLKLAANDVITDAASATAGDPAYFDARLTAAVARFQARHGLNTDGLVGPATLRALNRSPGYRARQIAANLERLRWLNRPLGQRHVMVNLAGFRMALVEDGREVFASRVVIGKRRFPTAEFSDEIEYMVVNPAWNVPSSIVANEILPALQADPTYLTRKNMELRGVDMPPESITWEYVTPSTFPGRVRQRPGPGNALGRIKFLFPNRHAIYLHDTPQRSLFRRDMRAYSHGCVRVMEPLAFARHLLRDQLGDPDAALARWMAREGEIYVHLDHPVPVHLTYRTAPVDQGAADQFRADVYGRDAQIATALEAAGLALPPG